jgi:hypothetical protein
MHIILPGIGLGLALVVAAPPAQAASFVFTTGGPDGRLAAASREASPGNIQIETADDFALTQATRITGATFTGLIPDGAALSSIQDVEIEFYRVFPADSASPPSGNVPTRFNSPADVDFASRAAADASLTFSAGLLNPSFTAGNSVVNGIFPSPNSLTLGEGPITGQEVKFDVTFTTPVVLPLDHWFFRPEVLLSNGTFLWLSAARPIAPPATPFSPDLQAWIRNDNLAPDWLRLGTDIVGQTTFNMAFSLTGDAVPEPATWALAITGFAAAGVALRRRRAAREGA